MDLCALGLDDWFRDQETVALQPGRALARVVTVDRGSCLVWGEWGQAPAELSGKLRFSAGSGSELPCVGDWVCVEGGASTLAVVHAVLPRKTFLRRKCPGKTVDFQMIASNLDVAFVVQSCHYDFNIRRLDRYLVMVNEGRVEPVVVLSKTDLVSHEELGDMVRKIRKTGITASILPVCSVTGEGLDELGGLLLPGKTSCLLGSSGVGKSTLINSLLGRETLETKAVSGTGEGVHTTARRQLLLLDNGAMLIDTPGMRELGLLGTSDGLEDSFSDIHDLSSDCRFSDCTHTQEPGCAVLGALECGDLEGERHRSYLKLKKETAYHDLSYVEKRKKDRNLGRFYKSVLKHKKR
jgi:ribosome biogenesis GTPase / thiamine phosphate phosphatase